MRQVTLKIFFNKATNLYCGSTDKWSMQSTQQSTHARTHILEIIFQSPKSLILNSHAALTLLSYGLSTMYMFFFAALAKLMHFDPVSCHARIIQMLPISRCFYHSFHRTPERNIIVYASFLVVSILLHDFCWGNQMRGKNLFLECFSCFSDFTSEKKTPTMSQTNMKIEVCTQKLDFFLLLLDFNMSWNILSNFSKLSYPH